MEIKGNEINLELWPRQEQVRTSEANEIFFGGAAGPGKSHLLRVLAIQYCSEIPYLQVYFIRRLFVDLAPNHIDGPTGFRAMLAPWIESKYVQIVEDEIRWFNGENGQVGSKIHLCHFQDWKDRKKFQGPEVHVALIDELTHFEERMYRWIRGRNRLGALEGKMREQIKRGEIPKWYLDDVDDTKPKGDPGRIKKQGKFPLIVSASNPGDLGHAWVKRTFVDYAEPDNVIDTTREEGNRTRVFFPATLDDNPDLDDRYEDNLYGLGDEAMVRAMRYGDWDIVAGGFFSEFRREKHVITPFGIPKHWPRIVAMDWGWHYPFSVGWLAYVTEDYKDLLTGQEVPSGAVILYKEWYGSNGKDRGLELSPTEVAEGIKQRHGNDPEPMIWVADQRIWKTDTGKSAGIEFSNAGIVWSRGAGNPGDRKDGWREYKIRLKAEPPLFYIFDQCLDSIRTVGQLVRSEADPEDIAKGSEDHAADMHRYGLMSIAKGGLSNYKKPSTIDYHKPLTFNDYWESHEKAIAAKETRESLL